MFEHVAHSIPLPVKVHVNVLYNQAKSPLTLRVYISASCLFVYFYIFKSCRFYN